MSCREATPVETQLWGDTWQGSRGKLGNDGRNKSRLELQDFIFKRIWGFSLFYKILSSCSNLAWRTSVCLFILAFKFDSQLIWALEKVWSSSRVCGLLGFFYVWELKWNNFSISGVTGSSIGSSLGCLCFKVTPEK